MKTIYKVFIAGTLFALSLVIPDPIPFVDEFILGILTGKYTLDFAGGKK